MDVKVAESVTLNEPGTLIDAKVAARSITLASSIQLKCGMWGPNSEYLGECSGQLQPGRAQCEPDKYHMYGPGHCSADEAKGTALIVVDCD